MATVNVRRLDEEVVHKLKARAEANDRSLEAELRHILEQVVAGDDYQAKKRAFLEYSKKLRALTAGRHHTPSEELIREDRDSDHYHMHRR